MVDENIDEKELERMRDAGVRIDLLFKSGVEVSDGRRLADRVARFGWRLQVLVDVGAFADRNATLGMPPVDVVYDPMGPMPTSIGTDHPGFGEMLDMLARGKAWAELSSAYRIATDDDPPSPAAEARAIHREWPHDGSRLPSVCKFQGHLAKALLPKPSCENPLAKTLLAS